MFTLNNGKKVGSVYGDDDKYLLAKILLEAMETLGHPLSYDEALQYPGMPENPSIYASYFGSLEKACAEARHYANSMEHPSDGLDSIREPMWMWVQRSMEFQIKRIRESAKLSEKRRRTMGNREQIFDNDINQLEKAMKSMLSEGTAETKTEAIVDEEGAVATAAVATLESMKRQNPFRSESESMEQDPVELEPYGQESVVEPKSTNEPKPTRASKKFTKSDEQLWADLRKKAQSLGRLPTAVEISLDRQMASPQTYYNRLGTNWRKLLAGEFGFKEQVAVRGKKATLAQPEDLSNNDTAQSSPETAATVTEINGNIDEPENCASAIPVTQTSGTTELTELPIKIILPKGIKGTLQLTLEL